MAEVFSRTDFRILRGALVLVAVLAPLFGIGAPLLAWAGGDALQWEAEVRTTDTDQALPPRLVQPAEDVTLLWDGQARFELADVGSGDRLLALLPAGVGGLAAAAVALILLRLVNRTRRGDPFAAGSVRALRTSGVIVVAAGIVVPVLAGIADHRLVGLALAPGQSVGGEVQLSFVWFGVSMLFFALAEAFRTGERLTHDVEGLV